MDTSTVQRRRWVILSVLVVGLLAIVIDNTVLNVALKTIASPARKGRHGRQPVTAGMGDQLLHARLRRAAVHLWRGRRPDRPQARAHGRAGAVRPRLAVL